MFLQTGVVGTALCLYADTGVPYFSRPQRSGRGSTAWTNLCPTRSAPASIHVFARRYSICSLEVLHPHAYRFQALHLDAGQPESPHSETALTPLSEDRMPLLEGLDLNVLITTVKTSFDAHLTSRRLPRLRTLALCRTVAPQDA